MKKGRLVQMNLGFTSGHNVSISSVHYNNNFSKFLVYLNNSMDNYFYMRGIPSVVKEIYSLWRD